MTESSRIKDAILSSSADICGIAPAVRFIDAPDGFRPGDIYPGCNSVIVLGRKVPSSILEAESHAAYTHASDLVAREVDRITLDACRKLEAEGLVSVPVPTDDPYEYWDAERMRGMGILSLRHAGYLAGLGVIGKNTLLVSREFGNMMQLGAILVDAKLPGDPVIRESFCPPDCRLCIESCPQKALDGRTVNQRLCRPLSNYRSEKGYTLKKCNICRKVCPNRFGVAAPKPGKKKSARWA